MTCHRTVRVVLFIRRGSNNKTTLHNRGFYVDIFGFEHILWRISRARIHFAPNIFSTREEIESMGIVVHTLFSSFYGCMLSMLAVCILYFPVS